jgi:hypothetical protein
MSAMSNLDIMFQELNNAIKYKTGDVETHYQIMLNAYPQLKSDDLFAMFKEWQPTCVSCGEKFNRDLVNENYVCSACVADEKQVNCFNCGYESEAGSLDAVNGYCQNCANAYDNGLETGQGDTIQTIAGLLSGDKREFILNGSEPANLYTRLIIAVRGN